MSRKRPLQFSQKTPLQKSPQNNTKITQKDFSHEESAKNYQSNKVPPLFRKILYQVENNLHVRPPLRPGIEKGVKITSRKTPDTTPKMKYNSSKGPQINYLPVKKDSNS